METVYTFTPSQAYSVIMAICMAITTVSAAIAVLVKVYQIIKKPERTQDERIAILEKKVERHDQLFDNDNKRLLELERGNRVMQHAMLALLSHALNGNNTKELEDAKKDLEQYLIGEEK